MAMKRRSAASVGISGNGELSGNVIIAPCELAVLPAMRYAPFATSTSTSSITSMQALMSVTPAAIMSGSLR